MWQKATEKTVLGVTGTQLLWIYVDKIQATVAKWEALWPIFDVCARKKYYERGGILQVPWWKKLAADKQLKVTVEAILSVARVRRLHESGRHNCRDGGTEGGARKAKGRGKERNIFMLRRRKVMNRWADDTVQRHYVSQCKGWRGRRGLNPLEVHWVAGRDGGLGQE